MGSAKLKRKSKKELAFEKLAALVKRYGREILGLGLLAMVVHDVFGTHGFLAMRRTQSEIKKVQANLEQLNKENVALEQEVKDLKSDPRLIEKIARDELGLARPGEVIIRVPQGQQFAESPPAKH